MREGHVRHASRGQEPWVDAGPPGATMPLPGLPPMSPSRVAATLPAPVVPGLSPRRTDQPSPAGLPTAATPPPASSASGVALPPARPPAPPPPVTGRYQVLDDYGDSFIGEVLLSNADGRPRPWTVRLVPPAGSGLVTSWLEGAPQGSARMADGVFAYTSGVDLAGGASVPLRFHFEHTGGETRPSACAVDGAACAGL
ncbi:cellulose-binding protein [Micromonospora sp. CPCC 205711]|uniref:cellulose-binding protein n=1 Tax=Micromonospora sp. CPCC 205547 TaxID=3122400 RepID=UPI002FEF2777